MFVSSTVLSGSYEPDDVVFLLKQVKVQTIGIAEKERLIQTGAAHYSEMISDERRPDQRYLDIFEMAFRRNTERIGQDIANIAATITHDIARGELPSEITLCSLVRAGVPYGVLIHRELKALGVNTLHYGISIIRDRGLDTNAMNHILSTRNPSGVLFVDGWTGKGAISRELEKSWADLGQPFKPHLVVLADPAGFATLSGSHDDWLIPSGILGANVSGLISRSILNDEVVGPNDYHGTMLVTHLTDIDVSRRFVDEVAKSVERFRPTASILSHDPQALKRLQETSANCASIIAERHDVDNLNRVKPGIAEATRAVLRRRPNRVFVRNGGDPDVAALVHLCKADDIPLIEAPDITGPYRAITLIEKVS